ncbi:MAG TPA: hypothetical protein VK666_26955, partial [Chryseolinea sp.]|nr:hypothetical protein [Chryseolinea sp.]
PEAVCPTCKGMQKVNVGTDNPPQAYLPCPTCTGQPEGQGWGELIGLIQGGHSITLPKGFRGTVEVTDTGITAMRAGTDNGWVSFEDAYPEHPGEYLIHFKMPLASYIEVCYYENQMDIDQYSTHWHPIPAFPAPVDHETNKK